MNQFDTPPIPTLMDVDEKAAHLAQLHEFSESSNAGSKRLFSKLELFRGVKVRLQAIAGETTLAIGDLTALKESSVITLDRLTDALIDVSLDGHVIARGQLVVVGDHFGVRIAELAELRN